jgi:hypothetical protein
MANKNDWQSANAAGSKKRDYQDGGRIMKRLGMLGIIGGAAILTAVPLSLQWSQKNVTLSLASAEAQERPLTATSVAGVSRRVHRRAYRRAAYASAVAGVGPYGYGSSLANCGYYLPYGTSYAAPCGVYSSSYAQAYERLQAGYALPYSYFGGPSNYLRRFGIYY